MVLEQLIKLILSVYICVSFHQLNLPTIYINRRQKLELIKLHNYNIAAALMELCIVINYYNRRYKIY